MPQSRLLELVANSVCIYEQEFGHCCCFRRKDAQDQEDRHHNLRHRVQGALDAALFNNRVLAQL